MFFLKQQQKFQKLYLLHEIIHIFFYLVLEAYQNWTGPTKAFENIFKKINMEKTDPLLKFAIVISSSKFIFFCFLTKNGFIIEIKIKRVFCLFDIFVFLIKINSD